VERYWSSIEVLVMFRFRAAIIAYKKPMPWANKILKS